MLVRELRVRPVKSERGADGETVYRLDGKALAVMQVPDGKTLEQVAEGVRHFQQEGAPRIPLVLLSPGIEFTLVEVDDADAGPWREDGRPSYARLEQTIAALQRDSDQLITAEADREEALARVDTCRVALEALVSRVPPNFLAAVREELERPLPSEPRTPEEAQHDADRKAALFARCLLPAPIPLAKCDTPPGGPFG